MNPRIETALMLASTIENNMLIRAQDHVFEARRSNDETTRQTLFDKAAGLRREAEFAGTIIRLMEEEREAQRPPSRREAEHARRQPLLRVLTGGRDTAPANDPLQGGVA